MQSEQINELVTALSIANMNFETVVKDCVNPFYKSKYADLNSCIDATRKALSGGGLTVMQTTRYDERGMILRTTLAHKSGQYIFGEYLLKPVKDDPQGYGAALTYARRYAYSAIIGIASDDDDDGNVASGKKDIAPKPAQKTSKAHIDDNLPF